jgi:uncharacterized protein YdhG (YjbR/CyaY superfamily)
MRVHEKQFADVRMTYIEVEESDEASISRAEYERLVTLVRELASRTEPAVSLSLPMFERMLNALAVNLLHGG